MIYKNDDQLWVDQALCRGMDTAMFFPERGINYNKIKEIKRMCKVCPVRTQCFELAMEQENDNCGIFGGTTPLERRRIRAERSYGDPNFFYASVISDNEPAKALALGSKPEEAVA